MIVVFNFVVCIFEIWILFEFFKTFLGIKENIEKYKIEIIFLFSILVFIVNHFNSTILNLFLVPIIYFLLAVVAFHGNVLKKIFETLIGTVIPFGAEILVVAVLNISSEELMTKCMASEKSVVVMTVIVKVVTFIIFMIIRQFSTEKSGSMDTKTFLHYIIVPLSSLGIMFSVVFCDIDFANGSIAKYSLISFFVLLMLGNAMVFYGYSGYAKALVEKEADKRELLQQRIQLESYKTVGMAKNKYMTLLHDTNHHMKALYTLVEKDKKNEALKMLESLFEQYESAELIEYSSNVILNTILSIYKEKTEKEGVECDIFVEIGFNVEYVKDIDLVAMVGNLLSNAYEAAVKSSEKKIKIQMYMENDGAFSVMKIENSFNGTLLGKDTELKSTKTDGEAHGLGIKSTRKVAENYNGWIKNSWENNRFKALLILENSLFDL